MTYGSDADDDWVEDDDDGNDLLACPSCGKEVYEETQQCPHCREWIIPVDHGDRGKRIIWAIAAILIIASMLLFTIL